MIDHSPFTRQGSGPNAVLLIHGILGSPGHFRDVIPAIPEDYTIYNILLDGHSGRLEDFSRSSMAKWKAQVNATLAELFLRHEKVVIVAHSMGTLFAIQAAMDHPDRIPALFLLSVPTRPWVRLSTAVTAIKIAFGKLDSPAAQAMRGETALELTPQLWKYLGWVPRMIELLRECSRVRKLLPELTVPAKAYQSEVDELVSVSSCKDLENHPSIQLTLLTGSGHFVYGAEDAAFLRKQLSEMLEKI